MSAWDLAASYGELGAEDICLKMLTEEMREFPSISILRMVEIARAVGALDRTDENKSKDKNITGNTASPYSGS